MNKRNQICRTTIYVTMLLMVITMLVMPSIVSAESPSSVSTIKVDQGLVLGETYQRHSFEAEGRAWVFWANNSAIMYSSSTDSLNWSTPTIFSSFVCNEDIYCCNGSSFSLWYDVSSEYAHIAYLNVTGTNESIWYARLDPQAGGTIVIDTPQKAVPGVASLNFSVPSICTNSYGYPYIAYMSTDINTADLDGWLSASTVNASGNWIGATNSTISLDVFINSSAYEISYPSVIPVTVGNVSVQYAYGSVGDHGAQNYAHYNVSSDLWTNSSAVDVMSAPGSLDNSWMHSEVAFSSANNSDDVFIVWSIDDLFAGRMLYATRYGDPSTPFAHAYFNNMSGGEWTAAISIRNNSGNLVLTAINDSDLNSLWSATFNMTTLQWGTLTDYNLVSSTSLGLMSSYQYGTNLGFLYYENQIMYPDENLNYGCYGCTPAPTPTPTPTPTIVPSTLPAGTSDLLWIIPVIFAAIIIVCVIVGLTAGLDIGSIIAIALFITIGMALLGAIIDMISGI